MSDSINRPYLVAALINRPGRAPDWSTYPVAGIHLDTYTQAIHEVSFDPDGLALPLASNPSVGNARHSGRFIWNDKRTETHGPNTRQLNRQAVSLVTVEDIGHIVALLGIDRDDSLGILERLSLADEDVMEYAGDDDHTATDLVVAHCLGANMIVGGLGPGQRLQTGYDVGRLGQGVDPETGEPRPEFRGAVGITGINQPCRHPGALLARVYGLGDLKDKAELFKTGARDNRGHVAQIVEDGVLRMGDPLLIAPYRS